MIIKSNPLNYKKHLKIWQNLSRELEHLLRLDIKLVFPNVWNDDYYKWFQEIESMAFREDLRYSYEEVKIKLENDDPFLLFIISVDLPKAFIIGYSEILNSKKIFLLDTIAIKEKGKGIGKTLLKHLIEWLKEENYSGIRVYTEEIDEKNIKLRNFYEKIGFILERKDPNGNLTMTLWF